MNYIREHISELKYFLAFLLVLIVVFSVTVLFPYKNVFLTHLNDISYFRDTPLFSERLFFDKKEILLPESATGHLISSFEDSKNMTGLFQIDDSLSVDGDRSIRLLADNEQHGFAKIYFSEALSSFKALQFYLYVQETDDLGDLMVILEDGEGKSYETRVRGGNRAGKWRHVWLSSQEFSSLVSGDPQGIVSLSFEIEAVPESQVQVNIDYLLYEDDRSFISSWELLNPSALSLEKRMERNYLVFQSVPRDHVVLYNEVPEFQNGRITAEISSPSLGGTCGLVLQGERTPAPYGIVFVTNGPGTPSWRLWSFQPKNRELLGNGKVDDWVFALDEAIWMSLLVDEDIIAVYMGRTRDELQLLAVFANPDPDSGLLGIASFDDSRCRFRDISIEYDPI